MVHGQKIVLQEKAELIWSKTRKMGADIET